MIELEQVLKIDLILWASALLELDHQLAIGHRYGYALHFSDLHLALRFFVADAARLCHEIYGDLVIDSSDNPYCKFGSASTACWRTGRRRRNPFQICWELSGRINWKRMLPKWRTSCDRVVVTIDSQMTQLLCLSAL
jgi:hypothetical protein